MSDALETEDRLQREVEYFLLRFPEIHAERFRAEVTEEYARVKAVAGQACAEAFGTSFAKAVKTVRRLTQQAPDQQHNYE